MKKISAATAVAILALACTPPTHAQEVWNGIMIMSDHSMSARTMVGAPVYNDRNVKIGTVQDIMVKGAVSEPTAILSVGEFTGQGKRMAAVPLNHLQVPGKDRMVMAGATKEMLKALPAFLYTPGA